MACLGEATGGRKPDDAQGRAVSPGEGGGEQTAEASVEAPGLAGARVGQRGRAFVAEGEARRRQGKTILAGRIRVGGAQSWEALASDRGCAGQAAQVSIRRLDVGERGREALLLVALEQGIRLGCLPEHAQRELPPEVERVGEAAPQSKGAQRRELMRRVAGDEQPAFAETIGDAHAQSRSGHPGRSRGERIPTESCTYRLGELLDPRSTRLRRARLARHDAPPT